MSEPMRGAAKIKLYAAKHGIPAEAVEKLSTPWSAEKKEEAYNALRDLEHTMALDPALIERLSGQEGAAGAGMALHLQMKALAPEDELERMIVLQIKAMHGLTLRAVSRSHRTEYQEHYRDYVNAANKCSRTFAALADTLSRHRGKTSEQKVTVEHVHVHAGGQAVVGNVNQGGGGSPGKTEIQPHASGEEALRREDEAGAPVPQLGAPERPVPDARGQRIGPATRKSKRPSARVLERGGRGATADDGRA